MFGLWKAVAVASSQCNRARTCGVGFVFFCVCDGHVKQRFALRFAHTCRSSTDTTIFACPADIQRWHSGSCGSQTFAVYEIYKEETTAKRAVHSGTDDNLMRHLFVHGELEVKIDGAWLSGTDCRAPVRLGQAPLWCKDAPALAPFGAVPKFPMSPSAAASRPMG